MIADPLISDFDPVPAADEPIAKRRVRAPSLARWRVKGIDVLFLAVCIVVAAMLRIDFMRAASFVIDADEAIVGLMAKHINEGRSVPTFYYGQHYMGSLEAILVAVVFRFCGISNLGLQIVPLFFSLLFIIVMFALTREFAGRVAAWSAAVLTTVPPVWLLVWGVKARGGFIEVVVLSAIALLLTCRWLRCSPLSVGRAAAVGLVLGIGWWVNNQIVYAMLAVAFFASIVLLGVVVRSRKKAVPIVDSCAVMCAGLCGFLIGGAPYWIYNIERGFPSMGMFGVSAADEIADHAEGLFSTALPIVTGALHGWGRDAIFAGAPIVYGAIYVTVLLALLIVRFGAIKKLIRLQTDSEAPIEMLLVFGTAACVVFVISTFGWLVQAPRYLLPLYIPIFALSGYVIERLGRRSVVAASCLLATFLVMNVASAYFPQRAVPGEPVVFNGERVSRNHSSVIRTLDELGIRIVRTNYWIGYRLAFETNERVTFVMLQEPHEIRIPEYEMLPPGVDRYELPLLTVPSESTMVRRALSVLGYTFRERVLDGYHLFYDLHHPPSNAVEVPEQELVANASLAPTTAREAVDGSESTRWGTGAHQEAGQEFRVSFRTPQRVSSIEYRFGQWSHDYPRGLVIEGVKSDGTSSVILDDAAYAGLRYFLAENRGFRLYFPAMELREVVLRQTRGHPILDWSIAELRFYADRNSDARNAPEPTAAERP